MRWKHRSLCTAFTLLLLMYALRGNPLHLLRLHMHLLKGSDARQSSSKKEPSIAIAKLLGGNVTADIIKIDPQPYSETLSELSIRVQPIHDAMFEQMHRKVTAVLKLRYRATLGVALNETRPNAIVIDETGARRYYAKRDYEAWKSTLVSNGFNVHEQSFPAQPHGNWSVLVCLGMVATDRKCLRVSDYYKLQPWQRISKVHGLRHILWRKDSFCNTVGVTSFSKRLLANDNMDNHTQQNMKTLVQSISKHQFPCWVLPEQAAALQDTMKLSQNGTWVVKPLTRGEGHGITLARNFVEVAETLKDSKTHGPGRVVQPLLHDPYLINGKKFDIRLYVLVMSMQPLRFYVWQDGLVRFATTNYVLNQSNLASSNRASWMTNTVLNKRFSTIENITWSFNQLNELLLSDGRNTTKLWQDIDQALTDTFLLSEVSFAWHTEEKLSGKACSQCFQLLGVDVILTKELTPVVIEINGLPSMQLSGKLESRYTDMKLKMLRTLTCMIGTPPSDYHTRQLTNALNETNVSISQDELEYVVAAVSEISSCDGFRNVFPKMYGFNTKISRDPLLWASHNTIKHISDKQSYPTNLDVIMRLQQIISFSIQTRVAE